MDRMEINDSIEGTVIGNNNEIGPNAVLENVVAGNNNKIKSVNIANVKIGDNEVVK